MNQRRFSTAAHPAMVPRGAALQPGPRPSGPRAAESHPRRGSRGSAVGGRARPGAAPGLRRRSREPRGGRCISRARGAPPSGLVSGPGPLRAQRAAQALPGPAGLLSLHLLGLQTAAAGGAAAHCSPGRAAARLCLCAKTQGRGRAAPGRGLGRMCECMRVCAWMRVRGESGEAAVASDSPRGLRTVARGGGGGARANSRSPRPRAAPWLIPERPVIGRRPPLCKRAEGMEFLGPGLQ